MTSDAYRIGDLVPVGRALGDYQCIRCDCKIYGDEKLHQIVGSQDFVCDYCAKDLNENRQ